MSVNWLNEFNLAGKISEPVKLNVLPGGRRKFTTKIAVPFRGLDGKSLSTSVEVIILNAEETQNLRVGDEVTAKGQIFIRKKKIEFAGEITVAEFICDEIKFLKRS